MESLVFTTFILAHFEKMLTDKKVSENLKTEVRKLLPLVRIPYFGPSNTSKCISIIYIINWLLAALLLKQSAAYLVCTACFCV